MKNMPDTFSIDFACLQIAPFKAVILYSFLFKNASDDRKYVCGSQAKSFRAIPPNNRQTFTGETFS